MVGAMPHELSRFFLQAIDADLGCPVLEAAFDVADLQDLRALLGSCADDDPELRGSYTLDSSELAAVSERFGVTFDPGNRDVHLERWHSLRAIPYLVHTRYELPLLLDGTKKFARMGEVYPPHRHHEEERFDRYVAEGLLHKEVHVEPFPKSHKLKDGRVIEGLREVYYTPKGEEWRIRAWKLVFAASRKSVWNEDFERIEGMLFGYEEWQMDWWITHIREQKKACVAAEQVARRADRDPPS
jgi:hypothetical protein